ncbi:MAG: enoyl-CoA hydratase/isomerase family protein [Clostridia bacterium]|nr:enoyl-CoA hydratase/isomerase family protein [Clostridia bacterium]
MTYEFLKTEKQEKTLIVTISRPSALNALNLALIKELDALIDHIKEDDSIYSVIFTGEGKSFVAGADIGEMSVLNGMEGKAWGEFGLKVFRKLETLPQPTIAAVNGFALGGGCELAMACDIRIASDKAKFGQPEVGLGITPGFGGTQRLAKLVGVAKAKEIIFTATMITAAEAVSIGLVNKVTTPEILLEEALTMAAQINRNGQIAVRLSKRAIDAGLETDIETGGAIEAAMFGLCFSTEDQKEAMRAFLNKEAPTFKNK